LTTKLIKEYLSFNINIPTFQHSNCERSELSSALSTEAGLTRSKGKEIVKVFFGEISNTLTNNDRVEIRGLCSFFVKQHKGYSGKNPKTGKPIKVKAKKLPFFKCGKELKEMVDTYK